MVESLVTHESVCLCRFNLILKKKFGRKKPKTSNIETSPIIEDIVHEEPKEDVLIITQEEESLPPPLATNVLTSGGGSLASF